MKKKKVIIVILVIIALLIIAGVVAAICLTQDSDSKKGGISSNSSLEWGDVYLKLLGDEENTEDVEDVKVQMADLNNDKVPECIIYGSKAGVRLYCKSI